MYLYNPETNDLKISNSPLEGYKEISQVRYKALLSKKADQKIKSYGKKLISIDGESGIQGRSTKIAGVSDRNSNEPTVVIDSDNGRLFGLILEVQKEAKVPTVSAGDASKLAANTEWVKLQKYVDSKTLGAYVTNSSLTAKTIDVNLKSAKVMDNDVATQIWVTQQSYVTATTLSAYAKLNSPAFTGTPTAPTANKGTENTQLATTAYVRTELKDYLTAISISNKTLNGNFKSLKLSDNDVATQAWTVSQKYITAAALSDYATENWVKQQGYVTSSALSGYATQNWVQQQGYATQTWVSTNYQSKLNFTPVQQGGVAGMDNNKIYLGWGNKSFRIQVDSNPIERIILASNFNSLLAVFTKSYTHGASVDWLMAGVGSNGVYLSCVPSRYAAGGGDQRSAFFIDDSYAINGRNSDNSTGNAFRATSHTNIQGKDEWSENPHYYLLSVGDYENVTGVVMEYVIREEGKYLKKLTKEEYLHILESFETYTDKFLYYNKEISELYEGEFPLEFKKLCSIRVKKNLLLCTDKWATKPYSNIMTESELNIFEELRALWHYEVCNDITTEVNVKNLPEFLVKKLNINLAKL